MLLLAVLVVAHYSSPEATDSRSSVVITAVGDLGASEDTKQVLTAMKGVSPRTHLFLGDFMYDSYADENQWCDFVYEHLGTERPIAIVSGNHESDGTQGGGVIDDFVKCMPQVPYVGEYAKDYYIDIPTKEPLARIFMISPSLSFNDVDRLHYSNEDRGYSKGSYFYDRLSTQIDEARAAGIPWIIVGMHKNCLAVTTDRGCDIGTDLMQLLADKNVDLILQGHEHLYGRTAQMTCFNAVSFRSDCMRMGWDSVYSKGKGPVTVIAGTGGRSLYTPNMDKPSIGYFKKLQGKNMELEYGFLKLHMSKASIRGEFISKNNDVLDHFLVRDNK